MKVKLGDTVIDIVTGFTGVATSRVEYLTGCVQYGVVPKATQGSKFPDTTYIDDVRLEVTQPKSEQFDAGPAPGGENRSDAPGF